MRKEVRYGEPVVGEARYKRVFLWLPLTLQVRGNISFETRWFEFAIIQQTFATLGYEEYENLDRHPVYGWRDLAWYDLDIPQNTPIYNRIGC
jgi:hypothetical protein